MPNDPNDPAVIGRQVTVGYECMKPKRKRTRIADRKQEVRANAKLTHPLPVKLPWWRRLIRRVRSAIRTLKL